MQRETFNKNAKILEKIIVGLGVLLVIHSRAVAVAQDRTMAAAAHAATAQERLLMEQIDQLETAGQLNEAIQSLERLVDNAEGRVVEFGPPQQAATLSAQLYCPIHRWAQWRLSAWRGDKRRELTTAIRGQEQLATNAIESAQSRHDAIELQKVVDRYPLAPAASAARLFLCDLYLDRGWTVAARQALESPATSIRVPLSDLADTAQTLGNTLPWSIAWPQLDRRTDIASLLDRSRATVDDLPSLPAGQLSAEVVARIVKIASFDCPAAEFNDACAWALAMAERLPSLDQDRLRQAVESAKRTFAEREAQPDRSNERWPTFAGNSLRLATVAKAPSIGSWPSWTTQLDRLTGGTDRNPASKPPVAENGLGLLPYHPIIDGGRVYVNELTRIMAFDLANGAQWPPIDPPLALFDSGMTGANYLPFGYSMMGAPRGTLTIDDDVLYARMGPPVTGWYGRSPGNADGSLSYIVALELSRQGGMRPGFPVRLDATRFPHAEFEGCPTAVGDQLIVSVGTRDNVNLRRSIVSIEKASGRIRWRSPTLASGTVSGSEQASLVAHQLVSVTGGRVLVNTNLGAIACVDVTNGQIVWLVRYRRTPPAVDQAYPLPDRYRYRDLTPCMVVGSQVICAPQDCPEIFSLDVTTGDLLWSTDAERVDDATQLLGANSNCIVVAGDRLYWLDRITGRFVAAFPAGTTAEAVGSLPSPRGFGRGVMSDEYVYWPTQTEIYVFDADQQNQAIDGVPEIRQRIRLDTRGAEGGNLVIDSTSILVAGSNRMFVFRNTSKTSGTRPNH